MVQYVGNSALGENPVKAMRTGPKGGKGNTPFPKSMPQENSNIVKGKSSRTMNVKGGGSDKKQGPR